MSEPEAMDPLAAMAAHSLQASGAPRFLIQLLTLPAGEHLIPLDHPEVDANDRSAWLLIEDSDEARRAVLSFPSRFTAEGQAGLAMPAVWHHYVVEDGTLSEAKTLEESVPDRLDVSVELRDMAAGSLAVEDFCDACSLALDTSIAGTDAPSPIESKPPFSGRL